jgi:hypothetical protein
MSAANTIAQALPSTGSPECERHATFSIHATSTRMCQCWVGSLPVPAATYHDVASYKISAVWSQIIALLLTVLPNFPYMVDATPSSPEHATFSLKASNSGNLVM